jgi:hypothetical protein
MDYFYVVLIEIPWVIFSQLKLIYNGFQFKHHVPFLFDGEYQNPSKTKTLSFSFIDNGIINDMKSFFNSSPFVS